VRVGYFINNEYTDPELQENPPATPQFDKVLYIFIQQNKTFPFVRRS